MLEANVAAFGSCDLVAQVFENANKLVSRNGAR
jgi:hypothetical protein